MMHLFRVNSFKSANSADPDEIPHYAARHPGPHCLPRFLLASIHRHEHFQQLIMMATKCDMGQLQSSKSVT